MEVEFSRHWNSSFLNPISVHMLNEDDSEILCKCGKLATLGVMGKETVMFRCSDCTPMSDHCPELLEE